MGIYYSKCMLCLCSHAVAIQLLQQYVSILRQHFFKTEKKVNAVQTPHAAMDIGTRAKPHIGYNL